MELSFNILNFCLKQGVDHFFDKRSRNIPVYTRMVVPQTEHKALGALHWRDMKTQRDSLKFWINDQI